MWDPPTSDQPEAADTQDPVEQLYVKAPMTPEDPWSRTRLKLSDLCRQSQLAKMTSELCEDRGDGQREKEAPAVSKASSVSPLSAATSLELPGPWSSPLSPVTALVGMFSCHVQAVQF